MTKTEKKESKKAISVFDDLEIVMMVNTLSSSSMSIEPIDALTQSGTFARNADVVCAPNVLDIPKFIVDHADEIFEVLSRKECIVRYKFTFVAMVHPLKTKIEKDAVDEFIGVAFSKTNYTKSFLFTDVSCSASVECEDYSMKNGILTATGWVEVTNFKWKKETDLGIAPPSEIYASVVQKRGETFECLKQDSWSGDIAWDGFPQSRILSYIRAAKEIKDIKVKVSDSSIQFYAKKIDPEDFLNTAALAVFPEPNVDRKSASIGDIFSAFFRLVGYKYPIELDFTSDRYLSLSSFSDGIIGTKFSDTFYEDTFGDLILGELKSLKKLEKLLKDMLEAYKTGSKNQKFLEYCRELFKSEIMSNPLKYLKEEYKGDYSDEVKAAAKCILGKVDDLYGDDEEEYDD